MQSIPKKIDEQLKDRAVQLVTEHQQEYPSLTAACEAVAKQVGVDKESVGRCVRQGDVDRGERTGITTVESEEIPQVEGGKPTVA
jgi:transposase